MADRRIADFATAEEAQDNDLLLISSDEETYNIKVKTIKDAVKGDADRAEAAAQAAQTAAETANTNAAQAASLAAAANQNSQTALTGASTAASNATSAASSASAAAAAALRAEQALTDATQAADAITEFAEDFDALKNTIDSKVDDAYVQDGYLYMKSGDEIVVGPLGPFSGGGGGGGGGSTSAGINLTNVVKPTSVRNGANAIFSFVAISTDDTNISVDWFVDGVKRSTMSDRASGSTFSFNAKDYLKPSDTSTVRAMITSESGASLPRQWNITSSAFSLSWGAAINPVTLYTANEDVFVVVNVSAQARTENIVTLSIGQTDLTQNVVGSKTVTFTLNKSLFSPGVNTITANMVSGTDANDTATPISFKAVWGYGASQPIVAFAKATLAVSQYDVAVIDYLVYDPAHETASCTLQVGSEAARSLSPNRTLQTLRYVPQQHGTVTVTLTCSGVTDTMTLNVTESQYNIGVVTGQNLRYNLDPMGHANSDADRTSFGNLIFSAGFDWVNGGFQTDADGAPAFVVKKGNRATLPRKIFGDTDGSGKTIDISFRITNSDLYSTVAMQELNNGGSKGLILRANEGELRLNNTTGQLFRYCENSRIDLSINVEALNDHRVMTVWLDGIPSQVNTYAAGTLVQEENALVIGSDHCDVWVYAIRAYNNSLTNREMIQNYISLGSTTEEKITRCKDNDVFDDNGNITPATLHDARPDLTIVQISAERMTTGKSDPVDAVITIRDGANLLTLDSGTKFKVQGTSSAAYGRSAYNLDLDFKNSGKTYTLSSGAIPVNYINIKVNVASSENANNVCAADMYNAYQPYLVPARSTAGVRDTIQGKPCAVFFTNTSQNTIWIGSQQLRPGDTVLYAMGDICNSKKNLAVFGQNGEGEHYAKGCIEVSGNDTLAQQFKATSTYNAQADDGKGEWQTVNGGTTSKDYEWRAEPKSEDKADVVAAWNAAVAWVVSTIGDSAKFKAEVGDYFAINSLLYHFLYLEFYSAFDNVSKNTFYSYEWDAAAGKYLWNICKNYDDDTILGCDNDGVPLADYGADFGDMAGSRSLFNADTNTIWVNIQEAYAAELAAMYISLRGRGAWNAAAIIDKWDNYQHIRPHAAMAEDAYNKYILPYKTTGVTVGTEVKSYDDSYLARLQGSKTYQRRQFVTYQAKYMDGKYGYYSTSESIAFRANAPAGTTQNLTIRAYAKTYVTVIVDNGTRVSKKISTGGSAVFENTAVHSNATIYVTPESLITSITPINEINNSTFSAAGASKLRDVTLGSENTENTAWDANNGLNIPSIVLQTLSIRNIVNYARALDLSANVELESVDTRGTHAGIITLPSYAPLRTVHLNACSGITALNLNKVTAFSVENGNNLTEIRIENCNSVVNAAVATLLENAVSHGGNATHYVRIIGADLSFDSSDALYTIATLWRGYNALGEVVNDPVITGTCYLGNVSAAELTALQAAFPNLTITYGTIVPSYTVRFKNHNGTVLHTQSVKQNSAAIDPVAAGLIPEPTKASTVEHVYSYAGWDITFTHILNDTDVIAQYTEADRYYTVRYLNGAVALQTDTVIAHGSTTYNGAALSSASGMWVGWDAVASNVVADMDIHAQYLVPTLPSSVATNYDYLFSDDPNDNSGYTLAEFYGIIESGRAKTYFNVGDKIKICPSTNVYTDTVIVLQLIGFKHFKLTSSENFAETVFQMVGVMNATRQMNTSQTNIDGWKASALRQWLNESVFPSLPVKWVSMIKAVDVISSIGGTSKDHWHTTSDKLFLLSQAEVGFNATTEPYASEVASGAEEVTFSVFTNDYSRAKKKNNGAGDASIWWLRSPYSASSGGFHTVITSGSSITSGAANSNGVAFGFCI